MHSEPALEALIGTLYQAMAGGDFPTLERIFSRRPETLIIGTDPAEWWEDGGRFVDAMRRRMEEIGGGIPVIASSPRAFAEGSAGWAADRGLYRLPNGMEQPFRGSFVFHQEEGSWRLVQWHVSFPVANDSLQTAGSPTA